MRFGGIHPAGGQKGGLVTGEAGSPPFSDLLLFAAPYCLRCRCWPPELRLERRSSLLIPHPAAQR